MFFSLLFERVRWEGAGSQAGRPSRPSASRRAKPQLEILEDRTVPSGGYLFRTFDIPNAKSDYLLGTMGSGINNLGQVAGTFADANNQLHGYLGSRSLTTIDDPNAGTASSQGTFANGLNDQGQVAGSYIDASNFEHGFMLNQGQFTTLDDPNGVPTQFYPFSTGAAGINAAGQIVGAYRDANLTAHGYLLSGGQYTTLDDPNAGTGFASGTVPTGINISGQITGWYADAGSVSHGFLLSGGQYTTIDEPNAGFDTQAFGINAAGQIVGAYIDANLVSHGFLLSGGQYTTLDDPNAGTAGAFLGTTALGINDAGQIVGYYSDANNVDHGFLATPDPASPAGSPASVAGVSTNGLAAAAFTNTTPASTHEIGTAGSFGVNGDSLRGTAPRQPTIIATVPRTAPGSGDSGRAYVVSATPTAVGKHLDPVGAVFQESMLWSLQ